VLNHLSALAGRSYASTVEAVDAILKLLADQLGMRTTYLSRVDRDGGQVRIQFAHNLAGGCGVPPGSSHQLEDTY
jgi:hypothetical protein